MTRRKLDPGEMTKAGLREKVSAALSELTGASVKIDICYGIYRAVNHR